MIKCVAIDDEPIALSIIEEYCKRFGNIELKCFTSPVEGMECINTLHPDIVLLDIEMNSHNGVELAKTLPEGIAIIFTTAFSQYALDSYNVDAVDFLHKPIFYPRFEHAIEKALLLVNAKEAESIPAAESITLKLGYKTTIVEVEHIAYIEAMDNYVKIYRPGMQTLIPQITMKEMEAQLPADRFARTHRSYIVNLKEISKFNNRQIFLKNYERPIPLGRSYTNAFNSRFRT
ncbi:MAG: response regulator transcription factor [Bacteroidales bacterium]|nr:response regulator transcription factor [Bacteroidales bacterium]